MDNFLTFLYQQYFEAKHANDQWYANHPIPADQVALFEERRENDKRAMVEAEIRINQYMRFSFVEKSRLKSG